MFAEMLKKLTEEEQRHIATSGIKKLSDMFATFAWQARCRKEYPRIEPCYVCTRIAKKLGFIE